MIDLRGFSAAPHPSARHLGASTTSVSRSRVLAVLYSNARTAVLGDGLNLPSVAQHEIEEAPDRLDLRSAQVAGQSRRRTSWAWAQRTNASIRAPKPQD